MSTPDGISQPIFTSHRLTGRALRETDLDFIAAMLADPHVMRFWPRTMSRDEAATWIANHQQRYRTDGVGYWLLQERETGQPVGQAGLLIQEVEGVREIGVGYMLHRPFWGRGYATEAAGACVRYAIDTLRCASVVILIRPGNTPSLRVVARLGGARLERLTTYKGFEHLVLRVQA